METGAKTCGLHESTPEEVNARLHRLYDKLKKSPVAVPVPKDGLGSYGLIDYKYVKTTLMLFAYAPYTLNPFLGAPQLSASLAELESGNGAPLWNWLSQLQANFECSCPKRPQAPENVGPDALQAIACGDGGKANDTVEDLEGYFTRLSAISEFADVLAPRPICL